MTQTLFYLEGSTSAYTVRLLTLDAPLGRDVDPFRAWERKARLTPGALDGVPRGWVSHTDRVATRLVHSLDLPNPDQFYRRLMADLDLDLIVQISPSHHLDAFS